jgi:hypothetical protein
MVELLYSTAAQKVGMVGADSHSAPPKAKIKFTILKSNWEPIFNCQRWRNQQG